MHRVRTVPLHGEPVLRVLQGMLAAGMYKKPVHLAGSTGGPTCGAAQISRDQERAQPVGQQCLPLLGVPSGARAGRELNSNVSYDSSECCVLEARGEARPS